MFTCLVCLHTHYNSARFYHLAACAGHPIGRMILRRVVILGCKRLYWQIPPILMPDANY